ncbi:hypothetical protein HDU87_002960 [Geranomyces variabilis]|uniref:Allene oxide cyclase barrel-like domain-containing protein n=1 Tax=Geranomyces variabilis TaxID=109894 RepID=A0AAD5TN11_9FUNG|nr:hypothetical protein HDU87_002960 [Geranomyces variabilis]
MSYQHLVLAVLLFFTALPYADARPARVITARGRVRPFRPRAVDTTVFPPITTTIILASQSSTPTTPAATVISATLASQSSPLATPTPAATTLTSTPPIETVNVTSFTSSSSASLISSSITFATSSQPEGDCMTQWPTMATFTDFPTPPWNGGEKPTVTDATFTNFPTPPGNGGGESPPPRTDFPTSTTCDEETTTTAAPTETAPPMHDCFTCADGFDLVVEKFNEVFVSSRKTATGSVFLSDLTAEDGSALGTSRGVCSNITSSGVTDEFLNYCTSQYTLSSLGSFQLAGLFDSTLTTPQDVGTVTGTSGTLFGAIGSDKFVFTFPANDSTSPPTGGAHTISVCVVSQDWDGRE